MDKFLDKYNKTETIMVVSSYPDRKNGIKDLNAVAWYTQKNLKSFSKRQKYIVLAEITSKFEYYEDGNFLVIRCWQKNNPLLYKDILQNVRKFDQIKSILLEFEFNTYGGLTGTALFPFLLLFLKLMDKRVVVELHQVLLDVGALSGHLNIQKGSLKSKFFNLTLFCFYKILGVLSNHIFVLEEELKVRLSKIIPESKITSFNISPGKYVRIDKDESRRRLKISPQDKVLLYFGYVNWYKGIDWLIRACRNEKVRLIIAGGESPTLKSKKHYQAFFDSVLKLVKKSPNVTLTGFLEDEEIPVYFSACDLVVLPYRTFMSASGPLSFALTNKKPFILSNKLESYFKSQDFKDAAKMANLDESDLFFPLNFQSFRRKIRHINLNKLEKFSKNLSSLRSPFRIRKLYLGIIKDYVPYHHLSLSPNWGKLRAFRLALGLG